MSALNSLSSDDATLLAQRLATLAGDSAQAAALTARPREALAELFGADAVAALPDHDVAALADEVAARLNAEAPQALTDADLEAVAGGSDRKFAPVRPTTPLELFVDFFKGIGEGKGLVDAFREANRPRAPF